MWKKIVTDYFSFTKKDRIGVLVLLSLIFMVVLLPYIWPSKKMAPVSKQELEKIHSQVAQLNKTNEEPPGALQKDLAPEAGNYTIKKDYTRETAALFYFDPNTLDATGWKRLGIRDKTILTIQHFLARGGKFKNPGDIGKIYGLPKDDYERLLPYVQIKMEATYKTKNVEEERQYKVAGKPVYLAKHFTPPGIIDINSADTTAFIALPGIGSKLAARIINFRNKLGGFYEVQQVAETYGLPDSTFAGIKPFLQCSPSALQQIDINNADANTLKQHPYIRWQLANAIVQYRSQHGHFKSVDELRLITIITADALKKMSPYLVAGQQ